ncbi:MAG: hypothetical protein KDB80_06680, partial [Planctomycetes bacterium]|nr:hypothetical protein [Planctomycetota bacterium]
MLRTVAILACCALLGWGIWMALGTDDVAPVQVGDRVEVQDDAEISARSADVDLPDDDVDVAAPRHDDPADDRVEVDQPSRGRAILGRLMVDGAPARDLGEVEFRIEGPYGQMSWELAVGSRGSFRIPIAARPTGGSRLVIRASRGESRFGTRVELPDVPVTALEVVVGEVDLAAFELLARGRIVDDVGAPVVDALVRAHASVMLPEGARVIEFRPGPRNEIRIQRELLQNQQERARELLVQRELLQNQRERARVELAIARVRASAEGRVLGSLSQETELPADELERIESLISGVRYSSTRREIEECIAETTSGPDGSFELHGLVPDGALSVHATASDHRPASEAPVEVGSWLELALTRTASLTASAILPAWLPARAVEFRLFREGVEHSVRTDGTGRVEFSFEDLDPCEYTFEVRMWNLPGPVGTVHPI